MIVGDLATGVDLAVIGGGPGGRAAALRGAVLGKDVLLVEEPPPVSPLLYPGSPSIAALAATARSLSAARRLAAASLIREPGRIAGEQLWQRIAALAQREEARIASLLNEAGVQRICGTATLLDEQHVLVESEGGTETYSFQHAVLAGIPSVRPPGPAAAPGARVETGASFLRRARLLPALCALDPADPELEIAVACALLGCAVTIVQRRPLLVADMDEEVDRFFRDCLAAQGVQVRRDRPEGTGWHGNGEPWADAAAGGSPCEPLPLLVSPPLRAESRIGGLERLGIERTPAGWLAVDGLLRTSVPHLHAVDPLTGPPLSIARAARQGQVAAEVVAGLASAWDAAAVPRLLLTEPPVAAVGLTEAQAASAGGAPCVGRALRPGEVADPWDALVKVIADPDTGLILGVHAVGPPASAVACEAALAIEMGATVYDLSLTVHAGPPGLLGEAAADAARRLGAARSTL